MATRFEAGNALNISIPTAYKFISGNASGTTPKVSQWIRLENVETIAVLFVTGATTNVTWTAEVAEDAAGRGAVALSDPGFPTGTNQNQSVTITMPDSGIYQYLRITGTPSAGTGAVEASPGLIVGRPINLSRVKLVDLANYVAASENLAGTAVIETSANWNPDKSKGLGNIPLNTPSNPAIWNPLVDASNTAVTVTAPAGSGVSQAIRCGFLGFVALRAKITLTSGFGSFRSTFNAKA